MYLIVGLGNPEPEYAKTRHNMGFEAINSIAQKYQINIQHTKFNGIHGNGRIEGKNVLLLKPQTYMNLSGESIIQYKNYFQIEQEKLIILYDDMDIEPGKIKIRKQR